MLIADSTRAAGALHLLAQPCVEPDLSIQVEQYRRLSWWRAGVVLERTLRAARIPDPDGQRARRTAFALWLLATGRLSEFPLPGDMPA